MNDRVTIAVADGIADVRLNRADKMNAIDPAMFEALVTARERLKTQQGLRAVVLSGEGPDFCAGLDFGSFQAMRDGERLSALAQLPPSPGPARAAGATPGLRRVRSPRGPTSARRRGCTGRRPAPAPA